MAASAAKAAKGTLFQRGDGGSPEVFTSVLEVKKISGPDIKKDFLEVTHMESPGSYKEFIASLRDAGEVALECNFLPAAAGQSVMLTDLESDTIRNYKILWPQHSSKSATFPGLVVGYKPEHEVGGVSMVSFTVRVCGAITWA